MKVRGKADVERNLPPTDVGRLSSAVAWRASRGESVVVVAIGEVANDIARSALAMARDCLVTPFEATDGSWRPAGVLSWSEESVVVDLQGTESTPGLRRAVQHRYVVAFAQAAEVGINDSEGDVKVGTGTD